jgi:transcription elongation GreA/GreB family factor
VLPLDDDDPEEESYLLADSAEERANGVRTITTTSPLGSALLGTTKDDEVVYQAPGGSFRYRIVGFRPPV